VGARVRDELLHLPRLGTDFRRGQLRRAARRVERQIEAAAADLTVVLAPDLLPRESIESILGSGVGVWWFCDDPFDFERRGLEERPPVLDYLGEPGSVAYVAHPGWAHEETAAAAYLPYAAAYDPDPEDRGRPEDGPVVVVGSPRGERVALLSALAGALEGRLEVWGWGPRARLGLVPAARPFRGALRGGGALDREAVKALFRSAGVVLNLQDAQMLGAWNPQTFDLMSLAVPQVVWNRVPIDLFEAPPPWETDAAGIAARVASIRGEPGGERWRAGAEEIAASHLWEHRAGAVLGQVAGLLR
jgi:hypothetical protein